MAGAWEDQQGRPLNDPFEPFENYRQHPIKVFVSYSHADRDNPVLKRLEDDLMFRAKVTVWIDTRDLKTGAPIENLIQGAITSSDYFLFAVSRNTAGSDWMHREFELASSTQFRQQKLRVIPVLIEANTSWRRAAQTIDFTADYELAYRSLCDALGIGFTEPLGLFELGSLESSTGIIQICKFFDERLIEALHKSPERLTQLSHRDFEKLVAEIFDGLGYEVELTKRTRDGGRDVIAIRRAEVNTRFLIECKHPDKRKKIGVRPVRELLGVKADAGASLAILATTAYFSPEAQLFFERNRWDLEGRDRDGILEWIALYREASKRR